MGHGAALAPGIVEWASLKVELALAFAVLDLNMADRIGDMDILSKIKAAKGAVDRVTANVDKKLETVFALEQKADDLSNKATAPAIRQLDSINSELTEIVNALEGNGGPPLDGDSQSTPSDGQSTERPTYPQS
jgi:hypothetical protein